MDFSQNERLWISLGAGLAVFALQRMFVHERTAIKSYQRPDKQRRKILITGAASGIGRASAILFHQRGWNVGIADINEGAAQRLAEELGLNRAFAYKLDVTDSESCKRVVNEFCLDSGGLDALVNSAGLLAVGMFTELDLKRQTDQIRVNVEGLVNMTYAAIPKLRMSNQSVIVSMASGSSMAGIPTHAVYAATKAAVYSFTEAMAIELHAEHIRVCDVSVGYVSTPMVMNQENRKSLMLRAPYVSPVLVAQNVYNAVFKARLHREHFYVEYWTALAFKFQAFCRLMGWRMHMNAVSFFNMPRA